MLLTQFFDKVEANGLITGVDIDLEKDTLTVQDGIFFTIIPIDKIYDQPWSILERVILGTLNADAILEHVTRVVGYVSRVSNWNKSKISELRDRHNGDYTIPTLAKE